jgi:hypothetical protein
MAEKDGPYLFIKGLFKGLLKANSDSQVFCSNADMIKDEVYYDQNIGCYWFGPKFLLRSWRAVCLW